MSATTLVSVEEYLHTSFPDGDREYVDGRIVERNLGEYEHAKVQTRVVLYLATHYKKYWAVVEVRVQVKATCFRVPDVCLGVRPEPERVVTKPPFLVVEILSPEDRVGDMQEKIDDYLAFGVKYVWVVNPRTRRGYIHTSQGCREAKDGLLRTQDPEIKVPLNQLFA